LSSCQKLLFSATLTHDPSKIVPLGLRDPRYFVVGERADIGAEEESFAFPATLSVSTYLDISGTALMRLR
jgi:ATP-dependent RNA helicase DDX51/DBP6